MLEPGLNYFQGFGNDDRNETSADQSFTMPNLCGVKELAVSHQKCPGFKNDFQASRPGRFGWTRYELGAETFACDPDLVSRVKSRLHRLAVDLTTSPTSWPSVLCFRLKHSLFMAALVQLRVTLMSKPCPAEQQVSQPVLEGTSPLAPGVLQGAHAAPAFIETAR